METGETANTSEQPENVLKISRAEREGKLQPRVYSGLYLGFFVWEGVVEGGGGGGGRGQTLHNPHKGLLYTDRISSWTFLFLALLRKLHLRFLKETKHTAAFCLKFQ